MKIAFLSAFYPFRGGIAQFNAALYREFEKNHTVKAFTFKRQYPEFLFPGKSQYVTAEDDADQIQAERVLDTINPLSYYKTAKAIEKFNPDFLIYKYWMTFFAPSLGSVAYLLKKKCRIITIVDNAIPHEKRFGDDWLGKFFFRQNHGFITMSRSVLSDLEHFTNNPNKVFLPHPVYDIFGNIISKQEALQQLNLDPAFRYLLFFGFIRRYKGLDLMLEAMADAAISAKPIRLLVAGECYEDFGYYNEIILRHNLKEKVILRTDFIPTGDVKKYFCAADMVVQPYRSATQSGVSQIAYHFERPMLVTNVGGLPEIIPDGIAGYVVPPSPEKIASAVSDFYSKKREKEFAENVGRLKEKFSWKYFADGIISLFNSLPDQRHD